MIAWNIFKGVQHYWAKMADYVNTKCENTDHPRTGADMRTWYKVHVSKKQKTEQERRKARAQPQAKIDPLVIDYEVK